MSLRSFLQSLRSNTLVADLLRKRIVKRSKVVIDYSSPNIAKRFHIGNLRSTLIGHFLDNLYRAVGDEVISVNYLGDWGSQFAVLAAHWPNVRPCEQEWAQYSDLQKINLLTSCYVEASALARSDDVFRAESRRFYTEMERDLMGDNLDTERMRFWEDVRQISIRHLEGFYRMLQINFDLWAPESANVRRANDLASVLLKEGSARLTADGLAIVQGPGIQGYAVVRKSDQSTLYLSRKGRTEAVDEIIDRGSELAEDFVRKSKTMKIDESQIEEVARRLSVSSVIVNDLKRSRFTEYSFSFQHAFHMNQSNALLLQMKHSRLVSLEKRNQLLSLQLDNQRDCHEGDLHLDMNLNLELDQETRPLVNHLMNFDDVLYNSWQKSEPCQVTIYLMQLANLIGSATASLRVMGEPQNVALGRLLLFSASRSVLNQGMKLIGLDPLEQM